MFNEEKTPKLIVKENINKKPSASKLTLMIQKPNLLHSISVTNGHVKNGNFRTRPGYIIYIKTKIFQKTH